MTIEKYLVMALSLFVLIFVIELVRREKLTFKYAFGWIMIAILALLLTVFDALLFKIAAFVGFDLASDFVVFVFLSAFVILSLLMSLFLCQQNNHNDAIAQKIGILEFEVKRLKEGSKNKTEKG